MAKKILVVDDESDVVLYLMDQLESDGYEVLTAYDGREGLMKAIQFEPDLIIMDNLMPQLTGFEVVSQMRRTGGYPQNVPIIIITAKCDMLDLFDTFSRVTVLQKPFRYEDLLGRTSVMLRSSESRYYPLSQTMAQGNHHGPLPAAAPSSGRKKIMLAVSETYLIDKLKEPLEMSGYEVLAFSDDQSAVEKAESIKPNFVLVQNRKNVMHFNAARIFRHFSRTPQLQEIPVIIFCRDAPSFADYQSLPGAHFICYAASDDLIKKIASFFEKLTAQAGFSGS